jgi:hypothetical protein
VEVPRDATAAAPFPAAVNPLLTIAAPPAPVAAEPVVDAPVVAEPVAVTPVAVAPVAAETHPAALIVAEPLSTAPIAAETAPATSSVAETVPSAPIVADPRPVAPAAAAPVLQERTPAVAVSSAQEAPAAPFRTAAEALAEVAEELPLPPASELELIETRHPAPLPEAGLSAAPRRRRVVRERNNSANPAEPLLQVETQAEPPASDA